jgi:cytochrome c6
MVLKTISPLFLLLLMCACGPEIEPTGQASVELHVSTGEELFLKNCVGCHGVNGKLGNSGAKNLALSRITDGQIRTILEEGKNAMPSMAFLMEQAAEMDSVIAYVKKLRK